MYRIAALAAFAATVVAAPAYAASIHVSTVGKSPEQVKADVTKAAIQLCRAESQGSVLLYPLESACVRDTVRSALTQSNDPAFSKIASR
jgi:hypothetical protein